MKLFSFTTFLAIGGLTSSALATPGDFDWSFGIGGSVSNGNSNDRVEAMALQADGKIVIAGTWSNGGNDDIMVTRYTATGSLDSTFNGSGRVQIGVGSDDDWGTCVAVQNDGKILVGGFSYAANANFALVRLNSDGSLDASFNGSGKVTTDISGYDFAEAIAIQSDGKIVLAGDNANDFVVVRYNSNGSLDTSFNGTGKVTTDIAAGKLDELADVTIQADGKIVVAGFHQSGLTGDYYRFAVARYNTSGSLDTSFNGTGKVTTDVGSSNDYATSMALQPDGRIVVAGYTGNGISSDDAILARYNANGSLDASFNGTGKIQSDFAGSSDHTLDLGAQPDGKILAVGWAGYDLGMARYNPNGMLDPTFGTAGKVAPVGWLAARCVALQTDRKILIAGAGSTVVRFVGDTPPTVTSSAPSSIATSSVILNGTVNPNGNSTAAQFEYGLTAAYGNTASVTLSPDDGVNAQNVSASVGGLAPDTQYYYRLTATSAGGTTTTTNSTFATLVLPPVVTTSPPTSITATSATLNGTVNPNGGATTASFEYGPTIAFGSTASATLSPNNGTSAQNVSANISGLAADTQYYYRLTATNAGGTSTTSTGTFATLVPPPSVTVTGATSTTTTSATLNGTVNPNSLVTTAQFQLGLTTAYGSTFPVTLSPNNGTSAQSVSAFPSALLPATTYHYRLSATSSSGTNTTADATFQTLDPGGSSAASGWPVMAPTGSGVGDDEGRGVAVDAAGNVAVVGSKTNASGDLYVAKYSSAGALIWQVTYDNPTHHGQDIGRAVAFDPNGNVVVTGQTYNGSSTSGGTEIDVYTAKYAAADGVRLWERSYNNPLANSDDRGFCVLVDANGDVIVGGYTFRASGNQDYYTAKYAGATGAVLWQTNYNGAANGSDIASSLALDSSGNVVVTGYSANASGNADYATLKYAAANGSVLWEHRYNGPAAQNDYANSVSVEPSGRVFVTGESQNADGSYDMHTLKIGASTGSLIWEQRYNGGANLNDTAYRVLPDSAGDVFVIGMTTASPGNQDFYTAKYAGATGAILWERTYNGPGNAEDVPTQLLIAPNGDAFVTGYSRGGDVDYLTLRYRGSDGYPLNTARTQGPGSGGDFTASAFRGAALLPSGRPVVTGKGIGLSGEFEIMTVAYGGPPEVQTKAATNVLAFTATLNGTVNPTGVASTAWFEYGTTSSYGTSTTTQSAGSGSVAAPRTANVTGLSHNTLYHYRVVAQNINGTSYGADMTFTTPVALPEIQVFAGADDTAPELTDGQAAPVDFGSTPLGTPVTRSFTVKNVGTGNLHVTCIALPMVYEHVGNSLPFDIGPNTSITFQVRFLANTVHGTFGGTMNLANDDGDEGAFDFPLTAGATGTLVPGGALDTTFGSGGKTITNFFTSEQGHSVAVLSDGKIVLAGASWNGADYDFALVCYLPTGQLDTGFGTGGMVTTAIGGGADYGRSVAIQGDGKIVVGGSAFNGANDDFAVARYTAAGVLDGSFGIGGKVMTAVGNFRDEAFSIAIQDDGKIVAAGSSMALNSDFAVVRYLVDGQLDGSFGTGGKATTAVSMHDYGNSVTIQADGKIVVAGSTSDADINYDVAIVRYTDSGTLDDSFGTGGKMITPIGSGGDSGMSVAVQDDGKLIVAGSSENSEGQPDFAVLRYTVGGALDSTFGTGGVVTTPIGSGRDYGTSVALQGDGKIVVAGVCTSNGTDDFALVRYTGAGTLDTTLGSGGKVTTPVGNHDDFANGVAIQPDGGIVVAGTSNGMSNSDFALVRYQGDRTTYPLPMATTLAATAINSSVVSANGTVNPQGIITSAWFEYGRTTSYGQTTASQPQGYGTSANPVSAAVSGLTPGTLYHYRLVAQNGETTAYGADMTFTTLPSDTAGPTGGTMAMLPTSPFNPSAALAVSFAGWADASPPLSYAVLVDDVIVSAQGASASRNLTGPVTPGAHTMKGRIYDAFNNMTEVTQVFTVAPPLAADGLVAEFAFAGNVNDGIGALHGTANGAALTADRFGRVGHAYVFDGVNDYLEIPDGNALSLTTTGVLSISVWVRPDGTSLDGSNNLLFSAKEGTGYVHWMGKGVPGQHEWAMRIYSADNTDVPNRVNRMSSYLFNPAGGTGVGSYVQDSLTSGQWIHYVVVMSQGGETVTWYKNGVQRDQDSFAGGITPANGSAPLRIGTRDFNSFFAGAVDDIRIYNRELTPTEIGNLHLEAVPLQAAWRQAWFGTTANVGNAADGFDFDNDGLANLIEWALGLNPTTASTLPVTTTRNGVVLEFTYTRSVAAVNAGAVFTVEWSDTLPGTSWSSAGVTEQILSDNGTVQQVKATVPVGATGHRFVHLQVTSPP